MGFLTLKAGRLRASTAGLVDPTQIKYNVGVLILAPLSVWKRKLLLSPGEKSNVYSMRVSICVCVCLCDRRRSPWLHLKRILQRGDPPFQAFRFLAPHPLQPSTQASLALSPRNGAADPGQSPLIVPLCYSVTALPSKGSRQSTALHISMVCQCPQTGRGQGNDGRLRHDGCTLINPWPFLLFSFVHCCAPVCFLNRNWTWIWPHRVFLIVFMIADSFTTSSTLRDLLCWDKSHFSSLICTFFFPLT